MSPPEELKVQKRAEGNVGNCEHDSLQTLQIHNWSVTTGLRHMRLLNPQGMYLLNAMKIPTVLNNMGLDEYPSTGEILKAIKKYGPKGYVIEASALAKKLGNIQMTNVVMLGALARAMSFFDYNEMKWLVSANSPTRFKEANVMGFEEGYKLLN